MTAATPRTVPRATSTAVSVVSASRRTTTGPALAGSDEVSHCNAWGSRSVFSFTRTYNCAPPMAQS